MASNNYWKNTHNTLSYEEDIDDETFLKHSTAGPTGYMVPTNSRGYEQSYGVNVSDSPEERRQKLLQQKKEIEQRTVQSTERSLSYLRNSEEVGILTAEELMRQREQLVNTEKRLDEINNTLRFSQKHIQGIKSVFGGLKNLLGGKTERLAPNTNKSDGETSMKPTLDYVLKSPELQKTKENSVHPGLRIRGLDEQTTSPDLSQSMEAQQAIDSNLDVMLSYVTRLKGLASEFSEEIESQNDVIENITSKVNEADIKINKQNKDINRLLKK